MPNNTMNLLVADEAYFNCVLKDGKLDLARFLPEPKFAVEGTNNDNPDLMTISKSLPFPSKEYTQKELKTFTRILKSEPHDPINRGQSKRDIVDKFNEKHFGHRGWFEFRNSMWGSKWGAYSQGTPKYLKHKKRGVLYFESAWGHPTHPIAVSSYYTNSPVVLYSICEGNWFISRQVFSGGKCIDVMTFSPTKLKDSVAGVNLSIITSLIGDHNRDEFIKEDIGYEPNETGTDEAKEEIERGLNDPTRVINFFLNHKEDTNAVLSRLDNLFMVLKEHCLNREIRTRVTDDIDCEALLTELSVLSNDIIGSPVYGEALNERFPILTHLLDKNLMSAILASLQIQPALLGSVLFITYTSLQYKALPKPKEKSNE